MLSWKNGEQYEGEFVAGEQCGLGAQWSADGRLESCGRWSSEQLDGRLVDRVEECAVPVPLILQGLTCGGAAKDTQSGRTESARQRQHRQSQQHMCSNATQSQQRAADLRR